MGNIGTQLPLPIVPLRHWHDPEAHVLLTLDLRGTARRMRCPSSAVAMTLALLSLTFLAYSVGSTVVSRIA